jgi:1-phosphofructokinase
MSGSVLAVGTSPAIDRISVVSGELEGILRASQALETPGGKAVHAAMVARALGAPTHLVAPAGGRRGELLRELLAAEGVEASLLGVAAETRATHTIVDPDLGDRCEVRDPPAALEPTDCDELVAATRARASMARVVVIAGGLPPAAPSDLHARLVTAAREGGAFAILDSSSTEAMEPALGAAPDLVKPNLEELSGLFGDSPTSESDEPISRLAALAGRLREHGAGAVWLSIGGRGSVLVSATGAVHFNSPAERIVNAVGCGDALTGGLATGMARGLELADAAALGVAAAADKLGRLHSGRVERPAVERLLTRVRRAQVPAVAVTGG